MQIRNIFKAGRLEPDQAAPLESIASPVSMPPDEMGTFGWNGIKPMKHQRRVTMLMEGHNLRFSSVETRHALSLKPDRPTMKNRGCGYTNCDLLHSIQETE